MKSHVVTIAANPGCELGENPLWHPERQCVYWTDIPAGKIYCFDNSTRRCRLDYEGPPVGGFTLQHDDSLLLFRVDDIVFLHSDGHVFPFKKFSDEGMARFNDVIADPEGRVFAGTIGQHPKCGLYRLDLDGTITKLFSGTGCSNGMGFSTDLKTFYWTCSTTRRIYQFDYDRESGVIRNQKVFYETTLAEGLPDGLTVDAGGFVWSARWGGGSIVRHGSSGNVLEAIQFPAANITSVCFGGKNLDELFVTSAQAKEAKNDSGGALFQIHLQTRGIREFRSRISTVAPDHRLSRS